MRKWMIMSLALCLMWGSLGGPTALAAETAAPITVAGRVTDLAGRPVPGALVQVMNSDGRLAGEGRTEPDGRFRAAAALGPHDLYRVRVWAAAYRLMTSAWQGAWDAREVQVALTPYGGKLQGVVTGPNGLPAPGATVELRAAGGRLAARTTAGDAGRWELAAPPGDWTLTGSAGGAPLALRTVMVADAAHQVINLAAETRDVQVTGVVVDAVTGRPLGSARVEVHRAGYGIIATATAVLPEGRFTVTVPAVAAPELTVRVWPPGYLAAESEPFAAPAGQAVEFVGHRALKARPATAGISGLISRTDGIRLIETDVWVEQEGIGIMQTARTDLDGRFRLEGLPAGEGIRYRVRSAPRGHKVATSPWLTLAPGEERLAVLQAVPGELDSSPGLGLVLGRVVDHHGRPVQGAEVGVDREGFSTFYHTAETDADGVFRFSLVATRGESVSPFASGYRIRVSDTGYFTTEQVEGAEGDILHFAVDEVITLTVRLHPREAQWTGRVLDERGRPVAGAAVAALGPGGSKVATATTDELGRYRLIRVPAAGFAAYQVVAEASGNFAARLPVRDIADLAETLPDLVLAPATAALTGRVTGPTGAPLSGVKVRADVHGAAAGTAPAPAPSAAPQSFAAVTDVDGRWRLTGLPVGATANLTVDGGPDWFQVTPAPVYLAPGVEEQRDVALFPATACLSGRVAATPGRPLAGVQVRLFREGAGIVATAVTDASGTYRLTGLATLSGWYLAQVDLPGYRPALAFSGLFPLLPDATGSCARRDIWLSPLEM